MKVEKNMFVSLVYELRENDAGGSIIETVTAEKPLSFVFGSGSLLQQFEENISDLETGAGFRFLLPAEAAYGERREDMIIDVPLSVFQTDGVLDENVCRVGNEVPMMDKDGNRVNGVINEISDSVVRMDFNHPMAGANLYFTGTVCEVRPATEMELNPPQGGCSGCSGHSADGCSSGTCS
jgi:FKBP-type peptidyl-prolyl cis-trans isomerase SlyD